MRKFLEYLFLEDDKWDYIFPSPIGHFVVVILVIISIVTCSRKDDNKDEVKHIDMTIEVDTTQYPAEQVVDVKQDSTDINFIVPKSRFWSSTETKLPRGIVQATDYAHGGKGKGDDQTNNYVTIKGTNGQLTIVRDVEIDLFLNLQKGDTIK
jgi:hypothetical protein